jgi:hypothetical protein
MAMCVRKFNDCILFSINIINVGTLALVTLTHISTVIHFTALAHVQLCSDCSFYV